MSLVEENLKSFPDAKITDRRDLFGLAEAAIWRPTRSDFTYANARLSVSSSEDSLTCGDLPKEDNRDPFSLGVT